VNVAGALMLVAALWAPPDTGGRTLGDALRGIHAFAPGVDDALRPALPPARVGARTLVLTGIALVGAGLAGMILSPGCDTRDARGRCVHDAGSDALYPALIVLGIGAGTTGAYWMRRDLPEGR
jgi:hypothetical protein